MTARRRASARRLRLPGLAGAAGLLVAAAVPPASAQQGGLPLLTFDLAPRLESSLGDGTTTATTGLAFSFVDATPVDSLSLAATGSLQAGGSGDADTFNGPVLSFGYGRTGVDTALQVDATLRRDDVADLADLSGFVDDNGVIVLPPDFDLFSGSGLRREISAGASLSLRQNQPFSLGVSVGVTDLAYEDTEDPDLNDSRRLSLGTTARLALQGGRAVTAGVRYSALDEEGVPLSETWGLDLGASAQRPRGPITVGLAFDSTQDGTRLATSLGRTLAFPSGSLSGSLGLARGSGGDLLPTLSLDFSRATPNGSVSLSLTQALRSDTNDEEELATTLGAGLGRTLSPRTTLSLTALFAATDPTSGGGDPSRAVDLGATVSYQLLQDWSLDGGVRGTLSDDGTDQESDAILFVGLSRTFQGTF